MTCRHFGNPTRGLIPVTRQPALAPGATLNKRANVIQLPAGARSARRLTGAASPPRPFIHRHWLVQIAIDVAAVAAGVLFATVTSVGILAALFILFFVRT